MNPQDLKPGKVIILKDLKVVSVKRRSARRACLILNGHASVLLAYEIIQSHLAAETDGDCDNAH